MALISRTLSRSTTGDLASEVTDLIESTSRALTLMVAGAFYVWWAVTLEPGSSTTNQGPDLVLLTIITTTALTLWLIPRRFMMAQVLWQIGVAATITLAIRTFQEPTIGFLYALIPLVAAVTLHWSAGLVAGGAIIGLLWWISNAPAMPELARSQYASIIFGGFFAGVLGWATTHTLVTAVQWSIYYANQAQKTVEEARDRRMETEQIREDLIHANQELARLTDRLEVMYQVAQEARKAKEQFVANVSHELRTPLNMIIGFSEMMVQSAEVYGIELPPALESDIMTVQRNSQHLSRLVDDVLDLSQTEAGFMALGKDWVSPQEIIEGAASAAQALFEVNGLYIEVALSPDLPSVYCDATRIRQVLLNLLSNAARFTEEGGVCIRAWCEGDNLLISVADTGVGIAPEDQEKLFEPFYQVNESIRRSREGSGLGLSISKRLVEMHGGTMWVESEPGTGTTITFSLPVEKLASAAIEGEKSALRWFNPYEDIDFKRRSRRFKAPAPEVLPRFVLLEQGEALRKLFDSYVHDVEVVSCTNIQTAMDELHRSPAQALIANTSSEDEQVLKEQASELPYGIPLMTCWVPGEDEVNKRLGVRRYLVKPVTRQALLAMLEDLGNEFESVLLVDDDREVLGLFSRILSSAQDDLRILWATDGEQALDVLRQQCPDLMLLDLAMPRMDGFQVLHEKAHNPAIRDIPVVAISALDPSGGFIASDALAVTCTEGLSASHLVACIRAISQILSPSGRQATPSVGQGQSENPAA